MSEKLTAVVEVTIACLFALSVISIKHATTIEPVDINVLHLCRFHFSFATSVGVCLRRVPSRSRPYKIQITVRFTLEGLYVVLGNQLRALMFLMFLFDTLQSFKVLKVPFQLWERLTVHVLGVKLAYDCNVS